MDWEDDFYKELQQKKELAFRNISENLKQKIEEYLNQMEGDGYPSTNYDVVTRKYGKRQDENGLRIYIDQTQYSDDGFYGAIYIYIGNRRYLKIEY